MRYYIINQAQKILDMIMQCNYNDKKLRDLAQLLNYEQEQLVSDLNALQEVVDDYKSLYQNNHTHLI